MGVIKTLGATTVNPGTPTPAVLAAADYGGPAPIQAASFSIANGIATIVLSSALPANGYNPPNSAIQGYPNQPPNGQQVTLWGFTTATYFNGKTVTVSNSNPAADSFSFVFDHSNVSSTDDTGYTAAAPVERYRAIRLECGQSNGSDFVYVGDGNVSSSRYAAALSLTGQLSIEIAGENIPPERVFIDGSADTDTVQISCIY